MSVKSISQKWTKKSNSFKKYDPFARQVQRATHDGPTITLTAPEATTRVMRVHHPKTHTVTRNTKINRVKTLLRPIIQDKEPLQRSQAVPHNITTAIFIYKPSVTPRQPATKYANFRSCTQPLTHLCQTFVSKPATFGRRDVSSPLKTYADHCFYCRNT